jgi:hypothetical protein
MWSEALSSELGAKCEREREREREREPSEKEKRW